MMAASVVTIFVAVFVIVTVIEEAQAVCCKADKNGWCADCTPTTPYCGYGKCNIFGCACKGGCRKNCNPVYSDKYRPPPFWVSYYRKCRCQNTRSVEDETGGDCREERSSEDT
ncbi:protein Diedel-like [Lingula anatina]|uniref:Protein Diedel-like n=1 Tax=Lingula anatina TaxID=7574 RepID=A0A1S3HK88_LINAN|nr:protein Diedel-like [Lingula anatina]XP_013386437.1 protein Diedel-like [Lingula anatina]|eukprot:XP_013386436.1 protein Diedel-like [Lingula anatina]